MKVIFVVAILALAIATVSCRTGQEQELTGAEKEEAVQLLKDDLAKMAAGGGDQSYKVVRVNKVTRKVVSGALYKYQVVLKNNGVPKKCTVLIWSRPLIMNGERVTRKCQGEPGVELNV